MHVDIVHVAARHFKFCKCEAQAVHQAGGCTWKCCRQLHIVKVDDDVPKQVKPTSAKQIRRQLPSRIVADGFAWYNHFKAKFAELC